MVDLAIFIVSTLIVIVGAIFAFVIFAWGWKLFVPLIIVVILFMVHVSNKNNEEWRQVQQANIPKQAACIDEVESRLRTYVSGLPSDQVNSTTTQLKINTAVEKAVEGCRTKYPTPAN